MYENWPYVVGFLVAWLGTDLLIPHITKLAHKLGTVDKPNARKIHTQPIPRLGGVAIFLGFIFALITLELLEHNFLTSISNVWLGIVVGATLMFIVGVVDDIKNLNAKVKLVLQIIISIITYFLGVRIEFISNPFGGLIIFPEYLSLLVTVIWLVGITNTINLIDGLDGLAAGVSTISAITLFIISITKGQVFSGLIAIILAGGTIGFLRYNFNPAKIFMGDSGSLFLGFTLAALSITGVSKLATTISVFVPLLILGVPIFDTALAIIRRLLSGKSIFEPDKDHLHHKLIKSGLSQKRAVLFIYGLSLLLATLALYLVGFGQIWPILIVAIIIILFGILPLVDIKSFNRFN